MFCSVPAVEKQGTTLGRNARPSADFVGLTQKPISFTSSFSARDPRPTKALTGMGRNDSDVFGAWELNCPFLLQRTRAGVGGLGGDEGRRVLLRAGPAATREPRATRLNSACTALFTETRTQKQSQNIRHCQQEKRFVRRQNAPEKREEWVAAEWPLPERHVQRSTDGASQTRATFRGPGQTQPGAARIVVRATVWNCARPLQHASSARRR